MLQKSHKRPLSALAAVTVSALLAVALTPSTALAADVPSSAEVAAAEGNTARAAALVNEIEAILEDAADELQTAQIAAMKSQSAYIDALAQLEERRIAAQRLTAEAKQAEGIYRSASSELGQLAADIYRAGGIMPDAGLLALAQDPGSIMYQASTVEGMAASRTRLVTDAETAASSLDALRADAAAAEEAAAQAAEDAERAGAATEQAMTAAAELVEEKQAERSTLVGLLAVLRNTSAALEEQRISGLEQERREAELARTLAASDQAAAPAPRSHQSQVPALVPPPAVLPDSPSAVPAQPGGERPAPQRTEQAPEQPARAAPRPPVATPAPVPVPRPATPAPAPAPVKQQPAPIPAPQPPSTPTTNPGGVSTAVNYARARVGEPYFYAWGGNGPRGYDCSGLVQQAFAAGGISLPRTASAQFYAARQHVPLSQAQFGDLVFWGEGAGIWHVAIYVGNNTVVNALNPSQGILEVNLAHMGGMGTPNPVVARF